MADDNGNANAAANAVAIKAPIFSETAADGWFCVLDAQFELKNITHQTTKYFHAVSALPPDLIVKIPAAIKNARSYDHLKEAIIQNYEKSKPELFAKLINNTRMTGRPSNYLQELKATAEKVGVGEDLIKHQFTKALPPTISPVVAAQKGLTLEQMGSLADELLPLLEKETFSVSQSSESYAAKKNFKQDSHSYSSNATPLGLRPFNKDQRPKICRGHLYFAEKSRTCKTWCRFPNKEKCTIQPNSRPSSPNRSQQGN